MSSSEVKSCYKDVKVDRQAHPCGPCLIRWASSSLHRTQELVSNHEQIPQAWCSCASDDKKARISTWRIYSVQEQTVTKLSLRSLLVPNSLYYLPRLRSICVFWCLACAECISERFKCTSASDAVCTGILHFNLMPSLCMCFGIQHDNGNRKSVFYAFPRISFCQSLLYTSTL
jgi:hypothetical protein